jgi:O-methyltransferase
VDNKAIDAMESYPDLSIPSQNAGDPKVRKQKNERTNASAEGMYLDLLKRSLTRADFPDLRRVLPARGTVSRAAYTFLAAMLARRAVVLAKSPSQKDHREAPGPDCQTSGETMMGLPRLDNIQYCINRVLEDGIRGDFIETGVWRGGAVIFMRAMLKVYGDRSRVVWVADSFQGVPKPNARLYPHDSGDRHWRSDYLAVSLAEVRANFARYDLLDDQVQFLPGWFRDTLPNAPIENLALLRLDGDIYESTMDALRHLYPKLSHGGYIIVDDYGAVKSCRAAVDDYRAANNIAQPMDLVEDRQRSCVYWRKV